MFCFSGQPLSEDEAKGKYGASMGAFASYQEKYKITMCQAPCNEPCCCLFSMLCFCPAQVYMRHKVLNHVQPGSGWSNYTCCQGYFGGCCCLQPGKMGEKTCPCPCMCLESCLCAGPAVSATSMVIRERYSLGLDEGDVKLIRCSNCLFMCSVVCQIIACLTPCEGDDALAEIISCISDIVFCSVSGCMTAQVHHELKHRGGNAPATNEMQRY